MRHFWIAIAASLFWAATAFAQTAAPDVSIVVYEGGFSFIEESRSVRVRKRPIRLLINDLPAGIQLDIIVADFPKKGGVAL